jgi:hypothetical protein
MGGEVITNGIQGSLKKAGIAATVPDNYPRGSATPFPPTGRGLNPLAFDTIWD